MIFEMHIGLDLLEGCCLATDTSFALYAKGCYHEVSLPQRCLIQHEPCTGEAGKQQV